jgi:hypothetical protein
VSDLESRLATWGTAEAAAAGEPPGLDLAPRGSRRLPVLAAVAGAVLVAGAWALVAARTPSAHAPVLREEVVPWADLPPAPEPVGTPLPVATADPHVPACTVADLRATAPDPGEGATGSWIASFVLTNTGASACRLTGRLDGLSGVRDGTRRAIRVTPNDLFDGPVVLQPGEAGRVVYTYYRRCDTSQPATTPVYRDLRLELLGGTLDVAGAQLDLGCDPPETGISAGPLGGPAPEPSYAPLPWQHLRPSLAVPPSVRAGEVLRYTVTLTNDNEQDVPLDPCPNVLQALAAGAKGLWGLNCGAARPVPARGSETFVMELRVPDNAPTGPQRLVWSLTGPGARTATGSVEVVAG